MHTYCIIIHPQTCIKHAELKMYAESYFLKCKLIWGHPDIPIPYVLLPVILLPDIPIPDMPKRKIGISIMFDVFLPNIPIPDIYTGF